MQPREWMILVLLVAGPLAIAVLVTLWSIKQMAYTPKKPARPKPVLSAADLAKVASSDSPPVHDDDGTSLATPSTASGGHGLDAATWPVPDVRSDPVVPAPPATGTAERSV